MSKYAGTRLVEQVAFVDGLSNTTPNSSVPRYVSLKNFNHLTIVILAKNATTVTGSAITLKQAQDVSGTGEKALALPVAWRDLDTAAADAVAEFAPSSDTFTTDATNGKNLLYVLEVDAADLDVNGGFDCVRLGVGNATATTITALYILSGARYMGAPANNPSAIVD